MIWILLLPVAPVQFAVNTTSWAVPSFVAP
jgi:hypothetical protein